jgi:hypothetical protein
MTPREERGLIIAATCRLSRNGDGTWRVPSQTTREAVFYTVNLLSRHRRAAPRPASHPLTVIRIHA